MQRSQDLRTLYTDVKAKPDLEETDFPHDGRHWGAGLELPGAPLMWISERLQYLERFVQVEMWRVRRERYWLDWPAGS
ncbi:MAG: hypothetical protein WDM92_09590 [Caulobacteraceae bacterium]